MLPPNQKQQPVNEVMSRTHTAPSQPRVGLMATVRNRRAIVAAVEPYDGNDGRTHLVTLEYTDADGVSEETLLWEFEPNATLLEPNALPDISADPPMLPSEFDALQRATRWSALAPFAVAGAPADGTITAPMFGAVQVEDFQLMPVLQAMQMPRISMLLADDVGLGKTIEAGLILTELLLRRRIRRVLILTPAALRTQWEQEMQDKFSLHFDVVDRAETFAVQKRLGFDANPWRTYPRIISSYYYLRQPDVLEQFMTTTRQTAGTVQLPWDLLIVDEAHNLMPAPFGDDSDLAKMLRQISPYFEHKLFLTATPHNGHTRSFSGLLEQLDPVRFTQTSEFNAGDKRRIEQVVVRRLKREINAQDVANGETARFSQRRPIPQELYFGRNEHTLSLAFAAFRRAVRSQIAQRPRGEQVAGAFAVEVLNKRLLSCPFTFEDSWRRFKQGVAENQRAETLLLTAAQRAVEEDLDDDLEAESRQQHAAQTAGAWLLPFVDELETEIGRIDTALARLNLTDPDIPNEDARFTRLTQLIDERLRVGNGWRDDERLIIFTEYKTTLDYLIGRLRTHYADPQESAIRQLFGGMGDRERELIKAAFNDPADALQILVATDAASEGLNLQETARNVLHYDIPWNPARLDQRNGRLDRHGQARDVYVFHFSSHEDNDLRFLARVVEKVEQIREDLGSMGELFDAAFERRFTYFEENVDDILSDLDGDIGRRANIAAIPHIVQADHSAERAALEWLRREIDLSPETLRDTLEQAFGIDIGLPRFESLDDGQRVRLLNPSQLLRWRTLIDDTLRGKQGALPTLTFDPTFFVQRHGGRPVFRPRHDTTLLHLGHPLFQHALAQFARARFPGGDGGIAPSRWTVRYGDVPNGADALLLLTVEELAVNGLRESFHHWVHTLRLPIFGDVLGEPLAHVAAGDDAIDRAANRPKNPTIAQNLWDEIAFDVRDFLKQYALERTDVVREQMGVIGRKARKDERARFRHRIGEVTRAMQTTTLQKLARERDKLEAERAQLDTQAALLPSVQASREATSRAHAKRERDIQEELDRRTRHYATLRDQLIAEKSRVIDHLLPRRYELRGTVQVFPVTVEIRLPQKDNQN